MSGLLVGPLLGSRLCRHDDNLRGSLRGFRLGAKHKQLIVGPYRLAIEQYRHDDLRRLSLLQFDWHVDFASLNHHVYFVRIGCRLYHGVRREIRLGLVLGNIEDESLITHLDRDYNTLL